MSYKNEVIDFSKFNSPTLICGDNGHGKSSIIDAITTVLYYRARGTDSRGAGIDDLINKSAKEFIIDYSFNMNNHIYRILRSKIKNGVHKLQFWINDLDQSSSIKETQQKILEILKVDYDTFLDTVCITQNNASLFMEKSPSQRKEIFSQILNLNNYDNLEKFTKDLRKELLNNINIKLSVLNSYKDKITYEEEYKNKLKQYQLNLNKINIDILQEKLDKLLSDKSKIEFTKSQNILILSQRKKLKESIERYIQLIQNQRKELSTLYIEDTTNLIQENKNNNLQLEKLIQEIQKLTFTNNEYNLNLNLLKKQITNIKEHISDINNYSKTQCEFCGNNITDEYKQQYINQLKEKGNNIFSQAKELKNKVININNQINEKQDIYKEIKHITDILNSKINQINININKKENLEKNIQYNENELNILQNDYNNNLQKEIIKIQDISEGELIYLKNEIKKLTEEKNQYMEKIAILKDRLNQIKDFKKEIKKLEKEINNLNLQSEDYKSLINAFGKSGIQSYIIENILPE